ARTWLEVLLSQVFMTVTGLVLVLAGYALLCIGVIPAVAWVYCASHYFYYQLYELYLQRGGMPIPLKDEDLGESPDRIRTWPSDVEEDAVVKESSTGITEKKDS